MVTLQDLFHLWCLKEGHHYNLACYFAIYFAKMAYKKKGALCGGSYITRLAKNLRLFQGAIALSDLTVELKIGTLNIDVMIRMSLVKRQGVHYVVVGWAK